jgi:hypothetical protein
MQIRFVCNLCKPQPQSLDLHPMTKLRDGNFFHLNPLSNTPANKKKPLTYLGRCHGVRHRETRTISLPLAAPRGRPRCPATSSSGCLHVQERRTAGSVAREVAPPGGRSWKTFGFLVANGCCHLFLCFYLQSTANCPTNMCHLCSTDVSHNSTSGQLKRIDAPPAACLITDPTQLPQENNSASRL